MRRRVFDREPIAYIVGRKGFRRLDLAVDPRVLIPRPETEHLVEAALEHLGARESPVFADVGTGSGCIAVAVLHALPAARAHALDCSAQALAVAGRNAERHGVSARLALHAGDLLQPLPGSGDWGRLDAVLSNPPYIVRGDPLLSPDVAAHEPGVALYVPGEDPLAVAMRIADSAREALAPDGLLALEVGAGTASEAQRRLTALGYSSVRAVPDLAGIERVVLGVR
jgi:release factor glutamine methyltransferase